MQNQYPLNLTRFSFHSMDEHYQFWENCGSMPTNIWLWHENLGNQPPPFRWSAICDVCHSLSEMTLSPRPEPKGGRFAYRAGWTDLTCPHCELDARDRAVLQHLRGTTKKTQSLYHVGFYSTLATYLSKEYENVQLSQYQKGMHLGAVDSFGIRYEDLTNLSFSSETHDCLICLEILEHIPDYVQALRETFRVLKVGGQAMFTFPWLGGQFYDHLTRARVNPDGAIEHLLPPEYHGDPASTEGILSFRSFGWKILDELREVGFKRASAQYLFGPLHGHMTVLFPTIVAEK